MISAVMKLLGLRKHYGIDYKILYWWAPILKKKHDTVMLSYRNLTAWLLSCMILSLVLSLEGSLSFVPGKMWCNRQRFLVLGNRERSCVSGSSIIFSLPDDSDGVILVVLAWLWVVSILRMALRGRVFVAMLFLLCCCWLHVPMVLLFLRKTEVRNGVWMRTGGRWLHWLCSVKIEW